MVSRLTEKIPVAVSGCLLGEKVRYDGCDKHLPELLEKLETAGLRPLSVCPEVGAGLGVPRPPVELVRLGGEIRTLGVEDRKLDATERIRAFAHQFVGKQRFFGFIGKGRSPSCGLRVVVHDFGGQERPEMAEGIFVQALRERLPDLPVIEAEEVGEANAWRRFVEQILKRAKCGGSWPPARESDLRSR